MNEVSWFNSHSDALVGVGSVLKVKVIMNQEYECASRDQHGDIFRAMVEINIIGIFDNKNQNIRSTLLMHHLTFLCYSIEETYFIAVLCYLTGVLLLFVYSITVQY